MIIECPNCHKKYKFDEKKFEGKKKKKVKCPKCGKIFEIANPEFKKQFSIPKNKKQKDAISTKVSTKNKELKEIQLALKNKAFEENKYSLAVLEGPFAGKILPITKPIITIGRAMADINIPDPEISRVHCQILIKPDKIILKDLNSTNGTYYDSLKITEVEIGNRDEFVIGETTLMLIITPKHSDSAL